MAKSRRRTGDTGQAIREAVGKVLACGDFFVCDFELPAGVGIQLSMTGVTIAYGNGGDFAPIALEKTLAGYPALRTTSPSCIEKYAARRRFTVMCGNTDRSVALLGCIREMIDCGISKILITTDTNEERDNLFHSLTLMRASLDGISTVCFGVPDDAHADVSFDGLRKSLADRLVCDFLTSDAPAVMLLSQPSFTRSTNIIRRGGDFSLVSYLAKAAPIVLTSSETVDSARSMAASATVFAPLATFCFTGEVRNLRDAVLFRPDAPSEAQLPLKPGDDMMQLGF